MVICLERGADCLRTVQLMPLLSQKKPVTMCRVVFPSFNLGQVVHTHVPLTEQYSLVLGEGAVMPCGLEGNRRSDVALAMHHRLQWFIHLWVVYPQVLPWGVCHRDSLSGVNHSERLAWLGSSPHIARLWLMLILGITWSSSTCVCVH